jgi:hypothetical protein
MRKLAVSFIALCGALIAAWQFSAIDIPHFKNPHIERLLVSPAHAQFNGCPPGFCNPVVASGATYTGPGDVISSGWIAWGSCARVFKAASASTSLKVDAERW